MRTKLKPSQTTRDIKNLTEINENKQKLQKSVIKQLETKSNHKKTKKILEQTKTNTKTKFLEPMPTPPRKGFGIPYLTCGNNI